MAVTITTVSSDSPTWLNAVTATWATQTGTWVAPPPIEVVDLDSAYLLNVSDVENNTPSKSLPMAFSMVDSVANGLVYLREIFEGLAVTESFGKNTIKGPFTENFAITDSLKTNSTKNLLETLSALGSLKFNTSKPFSETLAAIDSLTRNSNKPFSESLAANDSLIRNNSKPFSESLAANDSLNTTTDFLRAFAEELAILESEKNSSIKSLVETLTANDSLTRSNIKELVDSFATDDNLKLDSSKELLETLNAVDSLTRNNIKELIDSFTTVDSLNTATDFIRVFSEVLATTDSVTRNSVKSILETLTTIGPLTWLNAADNTWNTQSGTWANPTFAPSSGFYLNTTTDFIRNLTEDLIVVDTEKNNSIKELVDNFNTVDDINLSIGFLRYFNETLTTVDDLGTPTDFIRELSETLVTVDSLSTPTEFLRILTETLATVDDIKLNSTKELTDNFTTTDSLAQSSIKELVDNFTTVDSLTNTTEFIRILNEGLNTTDSLNTNITFLRAFAETLETTDDLGTPTDFLRAFAETLETTDDLGTPTDFRRILTETLTTVDSLNTTTDFLRGFAEGLVVVDSVKNSSVKELIDSFKTADSLTRSSTKSILETLTTLVPLEWRNAINATWATQTGTWATIPYVAAGELHFERTAEYQRGFAEGITIVASSEKVSLTKNVLETLATTDSLYRNVEFLRDFAENLNSDTRFSRDTIKPLVDALSIVDLQTNNTTKKLRDSLLVVDRLRKATNRPLSEGFQLSDEIRHVTDFARYFEESLGVLEEIKKETKLAFFEDEWFSLVDMLISGTKGVISDMTIYNEAIESLEDFEDLVLSGKIPGYGEFKNYIQGYYTYQKALVKAVLDSTTTAGRVELLQMKIEVDLPDVIERGSVTITQSNVDDTVLFPDPPNVNGGDGVPVVFIKTFKIVPEITLSISGGAAGVILIPEITSKSLTGFTIKLKNVGTGLYVPGTISWAAHGY